MAEEQQTAKRLQDILARPDPAAKSSLPSQQDSDNPSRQRQNSTPLRDTRESMSISISSDRGDDGNNNRQSKRSVPRADGDGRIATTASSSPSAQQKQQLIDDLLDFSSTIRQGSGTTLDENDEKGRGERISEAIARVESFGLRRSSEGSREVEEEGATEEEGEGDGGFVRGGGGRGEREDLVGVGSWVGEPGRQGR